MSTTAKCRHCGHPLDPKHTGPCPNCGKFGKDVSVVIQETINISESVSVTHTKAKEFIKKHPKWTALSIGLFIITGPISYLIEGVPGLVISIILGGIGYAIGPLSYYRIKETDRHTFS